MCTELFFFTYAGLLGTADLNAAGPGLPGAYTGPDLPARRSPLPPTHTQNTARSTLRPEPLARLLRFE